MTTGTDLVTVAATLPTTDVKQFSPLSILNDAEHDQAKAIAAKFDPNAGTMVVTNFGGTVTTRVAELTKPILTTVRMRDVGPARTVLTELIKQLEGIDLDLAYKEPANAFDKFKAKFFDPLLALLRSLQSVESNLNRIEADLGKVSDKLLSRITTFDQLTTEVEKYAPQLYVYAGATEVALARENQKLDALQAQLEGSQDPRLPISVSQQRSIVTRVRVRMYNLAEAALKAYLMVPVIMEAQKAAELVNDQIVNGIQRLLPDFRLTLAVLIGQYDTAQAAQTSVQMDKTGQMLTTKLAESLGQTQTAIEAMYEEKRNNVEALRQLRDSLVQQLRAAITLDDKLEVQFGEAYQAFGEITESVKKAVAETAKA